MYVSYWLVFVAWLIAAPVIAQPLSAPGCSDGRLVDPKTYFFALIGRSEGTLAPDWPTILAATGIPNGNPPHVQSDPRIHYGITQQLGAGGPRGVLFLPTDAPDDLGYYTRQILVVTDGPRWTWVDRFPSGPPYAPRPCLVELPPPSPPPTPPIPLPPSLPDNEQLMRIEQKIDKVAESLEAHRAASRSLRDQIVGFLRDPRTIATALGILAGRLVVP